MSTRFLAYLRLAIAAATATLLKIQNPICNDFWNWFYCVLLFYDVLHYIFCWLVSLWFDLIWLCSFFCFGFMLGDYTRLSPRHCSRLKNTVNCILFSYLNYFYLRLTIALLKNKYTVNFFSNVFVRSLYFVYSSCQRENITSTLVKMKNHKYFFHVFSFYWRNQTLYDFVFVMIMNIIFIFHFLCICPWFLFWLLHLSYDFFLIIVINLRDYPLVLTEETAYCIWSVIWSQSPISISLVSFQRNLVSFQRNLVTTTWRTRASVEIWEWKN